MSVYQQAWLKQIEKYLQNTNDVLNLAINDDSLANNNKVWMPIQGSVGTITKGRTPGSNDSASLVVDTVGSYDLTTFHTARRVVDNQLSKFLSYSQLPQMMESELNALKDTMTDWLIYNWYFGVSGKTAIETSGSSRAAKHPSQTGNRLKLTFEDVAKAAEVLDYERVPGERYMLIDSFLYNDLVLDARFEKSDRMAEDTTLKGYVGEICGFKVIKRPNLPTFSGSTILDPSQSVAATCNLTALCFTKDSLRKAVSEGYLYMNENDTEYAGTTFRFGINAGSSIARPGDKKGVVIIKEKIG